MKNLYFLLFALGLVLNGFSQKSVDTFQAFQYYQKGDSLLKSQKMDSALIYFKRALPIYEKAEMWERVVKIYNKSSFLATKTNKESDLLLNSNKALEILRKKDIDIPLEEAKAKQFLGYYHRLKGTDYPESQKYYSKALEIYNGFNDSEKYQTAILHELGLIERLNRNYDRALEYYDEAKKKINNLRIADSSLVVENYSFIAYVLTEKYQFEEAEFNLKEAKNYLNKESKTLSKIVYHLTIANLFASKEDLSKTVYHLKVCIDLNKNLNALNSQELSDLYIRLGSINLKKMESQKSLKFFKKGLKIKQNTSLVNPIYLASNYNNIGIAYQRNGKNKEAKVFTMKAKELYEKFLGANHYKVANCLTSLGIIATTSGDYEASLDYFFKALQIRLEIFGEVHLRIANLYNNISYVFLEKGDLEKALYYNQKSLQIAREIFGERNLKSAIYYLNSANIYLKKKDLKRTLNALENSWNSNLKIDHNNGKLLSLKDFFDPILTIIIIRKKIEAIKAMDDKNKSCEEYQDFISKAQELIDINLNKSKGIIDKMFFLKESKLTYGTLISTSLKLSDSNQKVYDFIEKSKANITSQFINTQRALNFSGIPKNLLKIEKAIRSDKANYQSKIVEELQSKEKDSLKIVEYENRLFDITQSQDSLTKILEREYPKYHELKYNNEVITVEEVQKRLDENTTLLEFFTGDSTTYAFTISKNDYQVNELKIPDLEKKIQEFRNLLVSKNSTYQKEAHSLYNELILPIKEQLKGDRLLIVPDGPLWHLNFDLLLTDMSDTSNPTRVPYLLRDYTISYANSATLYFGKEQRKQEDKVKEDCVAFSFSDSTKIFNTNQMSLATLRDTGDDLPGTRREIKEIAEIIDGSYYFGKAANESNFKKVTTKSNILHLALHGEVDNENPENSKLYFTKTKDSLEDDVLYAHELFALQIPSELTVLSACNTGTGKIAKGEGIMSLGTAFQYAGTKSLLLSNWEVSDRTAPELMKSFYTHLKEGKDKARALQLAKLDYLKSADPNRTHPFYWGGFYLVGDSAPIEFQSGNGLFYWILGGIGLLVLILMFIIAKKSNNKLNA